jgi:hypothetical protein
MTDQAPTKPYLEIEVGVELSDEERLLIENNELKLQLIKYEDCLFGVMAQCTGILAKVNNHLNSIANGESTKQTYRTAWDMCTEGLELEALCRAVVWDPPWDMPKEEIEALRTAKDAQAVNKAISKHLDSCGEKGVMQLRATHDRIVAEYNRKDDIGTMKDEAKKKFLEISMKQIAKGIDPSAQCSAQMVDGDSPEGRKMQREMPGGIAEAIIQMLKDIQSRKDEDDEDPQENLH